MLLIDAIKINNTDIKKFQKHRVSTYTKKFYTSLTVKMFFHLLSITMTAFFLLPYFINGLESAMNAQNSTIEPIYYNIVKFVAFGLSAAIELISVHFISEAIDDWYALKNATTSNRDSRLKEFKITLLIAIAATIFQLATAFGGLINTVNYIMQDKSIKLEKRLVLGEFNAITKELNALKNKKLGAVNGTYKPSDAELTINNSAYQKALEYEEALNIAQRNLQEAKASYEEWKNGVMSNKHNFVRGTKQLIPKIRTLVINRYNQMVLPAQKKVDEISLKISQIKAVKTKMTLNEWSAKIDKKIEILRAKKNKVFRKLKSLKQKVNLPLQTYAIIAFVSVLIFLFQAGLQNKTDAYKSKLMQMIDNLTKARNRSDNSEMEELLKELNLELEYEKEDKLETKKEDQNETPEWITEYNDFNEDTKRVFDFMVEEYVLNSKLPSIPDTIEATGFSEYLVKKARAEIKDAGFYEDKNTKIEPTQKFILATKNYNTLDDLVA